MARKCKYFYHQRWWGPDNEMYGAYGCKAMNLSIYDRCKGCKEYEPAELNPDWKDIIEEFNRRLSNG